MAMLRPAEERSGGPQDDVGRAYKEMSSRHPTSDLQHQRNHHHDPTGMTAERSWIAGTIYGWLNDEGGETTDTINRVLQQEESSNLSEVLIGERPTKAHVLSTLTSPQGGQWPRGHNPGKY